MKKIYLLACTAVLSTAISAQQTMKINLNSVSSKEMKKAAAHSKNASNTKGVMQLEGGVFCTTDYVASSTMDLNFSLFLTNEDLEFGDSLAITFPAGMTPVSSPNDPFAPVTGLEDPEALNGVSGQTISWGDNDDSYGGIEVLDTFNFTISVTIDAISGSQTANFHLSGDLYGSTPGDLDGTILIQPSASVGVSEARQETVSVYPSPSTGIFNIHVNTPNTQLEVYNLLGEKMYVATQLNQGISSIDLTNFSEGTYFVKIICGSSVTTQKIIISK